LHQEKSLSDRRNSTMIQFLFFFRSVNGGSKPACINAAPIKDRTRPLQTTAFRCSGSQVKAKQQVVVAQIQSAVDAARSWDQLHLSAGRSAFLYRYANMTPSSALSPAQWMKWALSTGS
jgi:hypothetical protein